MRFYRLSSGDSGITQTLTYIKKAVNFGLHQPEIRLRAESIIATVLERDEQAEVEKIYDFVKSHFRFTKDISGIETIKSPEISDREISKRGFFMGDCDCMVTYLAALLKSVGYRVRAVTISRATGPSLNYVHIYLSAYLPGSRTWFPLDGSVRMFGPGWEPPHPIRKRFYPL